MGLNHFSEAVEVNFDAYDYGKFMSEFLELKQQGLVVFH